MTKAGPLVFYLGWLSFCKLAICARKGNLISSKAKPNGNVRGYANVMSNWEEISFKGNSRKPAVRMGEKSDMDEGWNEPSPGVKVTRVLECLLTPLVIYTIKKWISTHRTHRKAGKCDQERIYRFKHAVTSNLQDAFIKQSGFRYAPVQRTRGLWTLKRLN